MNTLRILTITFLGIWTTQMTTAQISLGPHAGLAVTNIIGDDSGDTDSKGGLMFGANALIDLGFFVDFQPEITFIRRGYKQEGVAFVGDQGTLKANYLEIGALVRKGISIGGSSGVHFLFGPQFGLGLGDLNLNIEVPNGQEQDLDFGYDDFGTKRSVFSLVFGTGYYYELSAMQVFADMRYLLGINDIAEGAGEVQQGAFTLTVGARFPLN